MLTEPTINTLDEMVHVEISVFGVFTMHYNDGFYAMTVRGTMKEPSDLQRIKKLFLRQLKEMIYGESKNHFPHAADLSGSGVIDINAFDRVTGEADLPNT